MEIPCINKVILSYLILSYLPFGQALSVIVDAMRFGAFTLYFESNLLVLSCFTCTHMNELISLGLNTILQSTLKLQFTFYFVSLWMQCFLQFWGGF